MTRDMIRDTGRPNGIKLYQRDNEKLNASEKKNLHRRQKQFIRIMLSIANFSYGSLLLFISKEPFDAFKKRSSSSSVLREPALISLIPLKRSRLPKRLKNE